MSNNSSNISLAKLAIKNANENIFDLSEEAKHVIETFSEDSINSSIKKHSSLAYIYDEHLKETICKISIGIYDEKEEFIIVSPEDYAHLKQFRWFIFSQNDEFDIENAYVFANINKHIYSIHSYIMGEIKSGMQIDHINNNQYDNRRNNLRIVDACTNGQNKKKIEMILLQNIRV